MNFPKLVGTIKILILYFFLLTFMTQSLFAQPSITSFLPLSGPIGTTVKIKGANFSSTAANNIVYFGAVKAVVKSASDTSLTVTVPAGTSYEAITVTTGSLTAYSDKSFIVTFDGGGSFVPTSFLAQSDLMSGNTPYDVSVTDLDNDGKPDLVVIDNSSKKISIFRNTGANGIISFASKVDYATKKRPKKLSVADLNGDGKPDIVIVNGDSAVVSIFKNISTIGIISFASEIQFPVGNSPSDLSISDLDGDGKPDVAISNELDNNVSILRNTGTSNNISFSSKVTYQVTSSPLGIVTGDLDGDKKPEIIVTNYGSATISVLKNNSTAGNVSFAAKKDYQTAFGPIGISIGDLNNDNSLDVAIACSVSTAASILVNTSNNGTISFADKIDELVGGGPSSILISDMDGDSKPDLALGHDLAAAVSVLRNTSTAQSTSFASVEEYYITTGATAVAAGDINLDGKPDIVTANPASHSSSILKNNVNFQPDIFSFTPTAGGKGAIVTISGVNFKSASAVKFGGINAASFSVVSPTTISANVGKGATGYISVTTPYGTINSDSLFAHRPVITSFTPSSGPVGSKVSLTGTGFNSILDNNSVYFGAVKAEVITATPTLLKVKVPTGATYAPITITTNNTTAYANQPFIATFQGGDITSNSFNEKIDFPGVSYPTQISSADFDGDGKTDLVLSKLSSKNIFVFKNESTNGTVALSSPITFKIANFVSGLASGDIDGDGKVDLVVCSSDSIWVLINNSSVGNISFKEKKHFVGGSGPFSIDIADVDGDGKNDIVVGNYDLSEGDDINILRNTSTTSTISFERTIVYSPKYAAHVKVRDLDGDNKPEIVVSNFEQSIISVFRNTSSFGIISFEGRNDYNTGLYPTALSIGDLDNDGKADIVVVNHYSYTISIFKNKSTTGIISFDQKKDYNTGESPGGISISDLNGDGKPDIIVANTNSNTVSVFQNISANSNISFTQKIDFATGSGPMDVATGDLDGDGKPDLASPNNAGTISVLKSKIHLINGRFIYSFVSK